MKVSGSLKGAQHSFSSGGQTSPHTPAPHHTSRGSRLLPQELMGQQAGDGTPGTSGGTLRGQDAAEQGESEGDTSQSLCSPDGVNSFQSCRFVFLTTLCPPEKGRGLTGPAQRVTRCLDDTAAAVARRGLRPPAPESPVLGGQGGTRSGQRTASRNRRNKGPLFPPQRGGQAAWGWGSAGRWHKGLQTPGARKSPLTAKRATAPCPAGRPRQARF